MPLDKRLYAGSTTLMILHLLKEKDRYGYEMIETMSNRSHTMFELKTGTLYPLLHGLEKDRFILSYEKEEEGRVRRYYHLTQKGVEHLAGKKKEWQKYIEAVSYVLQEEV